MEPKLPVSQPAKPAPPEWFLRAVITVISSVVATLAILWVIIRIKSLIVWIIVALFLSFALEPLVNILAKRGWRRGAATITILLGFVFISLLVVGSMVPLVVSQTQQLINSLPHFVGDVNKLLHDHFNTNLSTQQLIGQLKNANLSLSHISTNLAGHVLGFGGKLLTFIFQSLTILLFTYYFVADGPKLRRAICSLFSPEKQHIVLKTWELAIEKTGGYLYSRLIMASIAAIGTFIVLVILGVPFALPLALFVGVISQFVPIFGTYIAAALPLIVAAVQSPLDALIYLIYVVVYQQIEIYLLAPRITARRMNLHPAVAFAAALSGGMLQGVVGAFLALPAAAIIQASFTTYMHRHEVVENTNLPVRTRTKGRLLKRFRRKNRT